MGFHIIISVQGYFLVELFERHPISYLNMMLDQKHMTQVQVQVTVGKQSSHLISISLACFHSPSDQSFRPCRFNSSRIKPFCGSHADSPNISIRGYLWHLVGRCDFPNNDLHRNHGQADS